MHLIPLRASPPVFCFDESYNLLIVKKGIVDSLSLSLAQPIVNPYFLRVVGIPAEQIIDLMWGRLAIIVFVNLGKVVEALRNSEINARLPHDKKEFSELFIPILQKISLPDGKHAEVQLGSGILGARLAYEYLSLQGFVGLVSEILRSIERALISKLNSGFNVQQDAN